MKGFCSSSFKYLNIYKEITTYSIYNLNVFFPGMYAVVISLLASVCFILCKYFIDVDL